MMTLAETHRKLTLYADKTVFVVGLGKSGLASARALRAGGSEVLCWDDGEAARKVAAGEGFSIENPATSDRLAAAAALVLSPGIPLTHPTPHASVLAANAAGVPVLGDIELLFRAEPEALFVGITGTNGKSTTTALIGHILKTAGQTAAVGGNLGIAALSLPSAPIYVLEMSSYQLDLTPSAMFDIAVLLNITPDHLDRHGGMAGYITAKRRILRPRTTDSLAIIGTDTPECADIADELMIAGQAVTRIASDTQPTAGLIDAGLNPALVGDHGKQNAATAYAVAQALGIAPETIVSGLRSFPGLAHRQERIATLDGITFINDSKATNAEATARALSAYSGIYWIAGGKAKDGGYAPLDTHIGHVRHAFLIGEAAGVINDWIAKRVPVTLSGDLATAIDDARAEAMKNPTPGPVILSPACASFDQFTSFEARGDAFRSLVLALPAKNRVLHSVQEAA